MRIVFLGEDSYSAIVLESLVAAGYEVVQVYSPKYTNNKHARLQSFCNLLKIPYFRVEDINDISVEQELKEVAPDLICVCHFEKILKKNIFSIPKLGSINLHPSLLPKYRGLSPQHWPIINGESETGITVHFIEEKVDTGDIIIQKRVPILESDYVYELQEKFKAVYKVIVAQAVALIGEGGSKSFLRQSSEGGSYYGRLTDKQCTIPLDTEVMRAYNIIRAVSFPYRGARFENLLIWKAEVARGPEWTDNKVVNLPNGLHQHSSLGTFIKFHDGILVLKKTQLITNERGDN